MNVLNQFISHLPKVSCRTYDVGNSHPHVATFTDGQLVSVKPFSHEGMEKERSIICSVNTEVPSSNVFKSFDGNSFLEMPVHYSKTLGHDRLSLAHLAYNLFPKQKVIIIDAGTFITVDFVDADGFQGGYIIPGPNTLAESYRHGRQLFKADSSSSINSTWPQTTEEAMGRGLNILEQGLVHELKNLKDESTILMLTGGQREFLQGSLQAEIDEDHLLHYALYFQYISTTEA